MLYSTQRPMVLVLVAVAAVLVVGLGARATDRDDLRVPPVLPPNLARWGEVPAWKGTFRSVGHHQGVIKSGRVENTGDVILDGTVFLDKQTRLGSPNDGGVGKSTSSVWLGRATASVRFHSLEIGRDVHENKVTYRTEESGEGIAEADCMLEINAEKGTFILSVNPLRIDTRKTHVGSSSSSWVQTQSPTFYGEDADRGGSLPVSGLLLSKIPKTRTRTGNSSISTGTSSDTCSYTLHPVGESPGVELVADPGGPYAPARGTTVTLDGSRSRPSKGRQIRSYKWKLTPTGCPDLGKTTEMTGTRVTFKALCTVTTELTVDDGSKTATRAVNVTVKERPWKTKVTTDKAVELRNLGFEPGNFVFGMNRCERDPDPNENHYYQPAGGSMTNYEEGTFWLDRVADSGPFRDVWFVEKGNFDIPRLVIMNQKLYPGGSVYELNAAKGSKQKAEIDRLRRSSERHEQLHSTLLERAVKASDEPAKAVERGMAKDRVVLKEEMNSILRDAHARLNEATAEDKVKAEMRKIQEFRAGGRIYYPASGGMPGGYRDIPSFAEKGD